MEAGRCVTVIGFNGDCPGMKGLVKKSLLVGFEAGELRSKTSIPGNCSIE